MATDVTVRIEGLAQLKRELRRVAGDANDLKEANAAVAAFVAAAAAAAAPRRTGRLAASVKGSRAVGSATVRASAIYAAPIHWGWPSRGIDGQPFIVEAAQATEPQWLPIYEAALQQLADSVNTTI